MALAAGTFGSDTYCIDDIPLVDVQVTNPQQLIAQRICRMLITPYGALSSVNDEPDRGYDVRQLINARLSTGQVVAAESAIKAECERDEQVQAATASLVFDAASSALSVNIALQTSAGPFALTLQVSDLTAALVINP